MSSCCGRSLQNCLQLHALLYFYLKIVVFDIQPKSCISICTVIGFWRDIELIDCFRPCKRRESMGKLLVQRSTLCLLQDSSGGEGTYWVCHRGLGWRPVGQSLEDSSRDQICGRRLGVDKTAFKLVKGSRIERDQLLSRAPEVKEAMG